MNRQTKRMMQKQKATSQDRVQAMRERRTVTTQERRRQRPRISTFLKEVRQELRKVFWPTRQEMIAYTMVVVVAVIVLTSLVFGLDLAFSKAVVHVIGNK